MIAHEAVRLERLVGDVLDLAKLDTRRFTLLHEEVDMGQLLEQAYNAFAEEARRRHRLPAGHRREAGDRGRRRPRAPDHLEPALERLPMDPDGGRVELQLGAPRTARSCCVEDSGPGITPRSRSGSSGRLDQDTGPASGLRSRGSSPSRTAAGSASSRCRARGRDSSSCSGDATE